MKLIPFAFENVAVRVADKDGDPWFVAADVCAALGLENPSVVVKKLDDDERAKLNLGRQGEGWIISESGMNAIVLRSDDAMKPGTVAHRFRKWVTADVLPTIRKTGAYVVNGEDQRAHFGMQKALVRDLTTARAMLDEQGRQIAELMSAVAGLVTAPHIVSGVGRHSTVDALDRRGIPRKGRLPFTREAERGFRQTTARMGLHSIPSAETNRSLYPVEAIEAWFVAEGNRLLTQHLTRQPITRPSESAQNVFRFRHQPKG